VIADAGRQGSDIGSLAVLEHYQRWRRFDVMALAAATDILTRLFSNDIAPLRLARDLGLALTGRIGGARRFLMRHAGGAVGRLPRLLRGEPL
jgi:2-octaprenyl-6-methoxyphenol hydroxylase